MTRISTYLSEWQCTNISIANNSTSMLTDLVLGNNLRV